MKRSEKKRKFNLIVEGIRSLKIQGAQNIAKRAINAYLLFPGNRSKKKLLSLRPTEPLLRNVLNKIEKNLDSSGEVLNYFQTSQEKINIYVFKLIKNNDVIFTHCHSSTVIKALIYAKRKGKKFEVYATETRPLYQGRKTVKELSREGIKTTFFIDSAAMVALTKSQGTKKVNKFFIGTDAILKIGIFNKVGSGMFAKIAYDNQIPIYIISNSWKYSSQPVKIEQRSFKEILMHKPAKLLIKNPSFEFVPKKYIKAIISELGLLSYEKFLRKVK